MTDYSELVNALRCCATCDCDSEKCKYIGLGMDEEVSCIMAITKDAAAAIEDMAKHITEMHERVTVLQIDRGHLETEVKEWRRLNNKNLLPKRGEWVKNEGRCGWHCSCCKVDNNFAYSWNSETGENEFKDNYCPNCGAKMEVQE